MIKEHGIYIFNEPITNIWFHAKPTDIWYAAYHMNRNFSMRGETSLNEFLSFISTIPYIPEADEYGWTCEYIAECWDTYWIDVLYNECRRDDGILYLALDYVPMPEHNPEMYKGIRDTIDSYKRDWDKHSDILKSRK